MREARVDMTPRVVICSRRRADSIGKKSLRFFPDALVCVAKSEAKDYRPLTKRLLLHPDNDHTFTNGAATLGALRNWVLDHVDDECIVMIDDDVSGIDSLAGVHTTAISDPQDVAAILANTARCAHDVGARVFGFNQGDIRKYLPQKPFGLSARVGGVIGLIGRELRYDPRCALHEDLDLCLQSLLRHRIIWQDSRFVFRHLIFAGAGGNAVSRSNAAHAEELAYLQKKWGAHVTVSWAKTTVHARTAVERSRA
jgi:TET-associated glycosyltransferase-like protein